MYLPAKKRLQHATIPTVTFDDAWYLLKPGLKAYAEVNGVCLGCIIEKVQFEEKDVKKFTPQRWAVGVWFMDVSCLDNDVGPVQTIVYINSFEGECEATSLSVYPRQYHDRNDEDARKGRLEARGRQMRDIIWNGHKLLYHEGELVKKPVSKVIVGAVNVHGVEYPESGWMFDSIKTPSQPPSIPETDIRKPLQYQLQPKTHGVEYLTQDLLFMLCPVHIAFVLSTETWVLVNVENTREIQEVEIPPEPILDQSSREIIDALAGYQLKEEKPWSADFIRDEGEGVVIMLHEIGIKEEQIQAQLKKWLALAELWQAILLIDECDAFLERREAFDIARNGVVAAFLRNIEYFSGLLFLTTNRVGYIDEAFLSRVHEIIHFHPLGEASRKVLWKSLLDKVHRDRPDKIQIHMEAITYLEPEEMLQIDWNGREIRNAMQTAIALAKKDAKKYPYHKEGGMVLVFKSHFEAVQRLNKSFKDYLTSIREENPIERAKFYSRRNDRFQET
ncbi:hypothetical protein KJ359_006617 [Pestalotiopsis sp. 9143b]|nr:hypothetical protein KJ359_006617 [Pestalotiopsis sp. 9143b]